MEKVHFITLSQLDNRLQHDFEQAKQYNLIPITGGISGIKKYRWAWYANLGDPQKQNMYINLNIPLHTIYREGLNRSDWLQDGVQVDIIGDLRINRKYGQYVLRVRAIRQHGIDALYKHFKEVEHALKKAGCFALEHKKAIPKFPKRIGVITSDKGAVIRDMIETVRKRLPTAQIVLFPASVSGNKAVKENISQIHHADSLGNIDTIIIGRGGGSVKDLQTYNDKQLGLAIYHCHTPIISAVGHGTNIDFISNYVADDNAITPTDAAVVATPITAHDQIHEINQRQQYITQMLKDKISSQYQWLTSISKEMVLAMRQKITEQRDAMEKAVSTINALDPKHVMKRGYQFTTANRKEVKSGKQFEKVLPKNKHAQIHFYDHTYAVTVRKKLK